MQQPVEEIESITKAKIIGYLKEYGEASVNDLSNFLKLTPMAIRKHLNSLSIQGTITNKRIHRQVGRPHEVYSIKYNINPTENLAVELLDTAKETYGEKSVADLLAKRNQFIVEKYKARLTNKNIKERVKETARIFSENGFETTIEEDSKNKRIILKHTTCPFPGIASKHKVFCDFEIQTLEELTGTKVNKVLYFSKGDSCCGYEIAL